MDTSTVFEFLNLHRYAVQATCASGGQPQAALVGFAANERLELFFDSFDSTRKVANLKRDPRIAWVIGGYTTGDERSVQYEGVVTTPVGAQLEEFKQRYFAVHPDGLRRSRLAGITYFVVRPTWIRYTDLNVNPPQVMTIVSDFDATENDAGAPALLQASTTLSVPWTPDMERKPVFNPFTAPQRRE